MHLSIVEALQQLGYGTVTVEASRIAFAHPSKILYERLIGRPLNPAELQDLYATFRRNYQGKQSQAELMPAAREALDFWQERGCTQSVLSLHLHDRLQAAVKKWEIAEYFVRVDGRYDGMPELKAESLAHHLTALGLFATTTLMIGDTVDDAEAAQTVGAQCILLASGLHTRQTLEETGACVIDSLDELFSTDRLKSADFLG